MNVIRIPCDPAETVTEHDVDIDGIPPLVVRDPDGVLDTISFRASGFGYFIDDIALLRHDVPDINTRASALAARHGKVVTIRGDVVVFGFDEYGEDAEVPLGIRAHLLP